MSNYIPRYPPAKKADLLKKRERELRDGMKSGYTLERLIRAAEKVRQAHLGALGAKRAALDDGNRAFEKLEREAHEWHEKTPRAIIEEYRRLLPPEIDSDFTSAP